MKFFNEARMEELQRIIDISNSKEEIVAACEDKIKSLVLEYKMTVSELKSSIENKDAKIERLKEQIRDLESRNNEWERQMYILACSKDDEIARLYYKIDRMVQSLDRPRKTEEIPEWVNKHFSDRLIFHGRAVDEITKTPTGDVDMKLLCDAIEYLAHEYRDLRLGLINEHQCKDICSDKYNRFFEVSPTGDKSIEYYTNEYKVKYGKGPSGKSKETLLDTP